MATLGEGCRSAGSSASTDHEKSCWKGAYQFDVHGNLPRAYPGKYNPGGHAHDIPEILLADEMAAIWYPGPRRGVVDVSHDGERPYGLPLSTLYR